MKARYRFMIAWINGADSNDGEHTGIESADDLNPDNEHVSVYEYEMLEADEEWAWKVGAGHAFNDNFTGYDSTSTVQKLVKGKWVDLS